MTDAISPLDQLVIDHVIADEVLCRKFLDQLVDMGAVLVKPVSAMTHGECVHAAREILDELASRESVRH